MAQNANQLVSAVTTIPPTLRMWPTHITPKTVAATAGAPSLARGLPMAYATDTGTWKVWSNTAGTGALNVVSGFLAEPHATHATDETLAPMMMRGQIHIDDIPIPSGETLANLKLALQTGAPRLKGLDIVGLEGVH